jgi:hypothetical protein
MGTRGIWYRESTEDQFYPKAKQIKLSFLIFYSRTYFVVPSEWSLTEDNN